MKGAITFVAESPTRKAICVIAGEMCAWANIGTKSVAGTPSAVSTGVSEVIVRSGNEPLPDDDITDDEEE